MSKRYIPYARKFFESEEWTRPRVFSEQEVWLDMVFLACYADHDIDLGKEGVLTLYRGEFYYSQRFLAKRWGWPVARVNRHLARLAEGANPRIERIPRETHFETLSETQVETQITVVRLCNYDSYNGDLFKSETPTETLSETPTETKKKQGVLRNKGVKNTHTHYSQVKDYFVRMCTRAHVSAEACDEACKACEKMLLLCGQDAEALAEHKVWLSNPLHAAMVEIYRCYPSLQRHFRKPLLPSQMQQLMRMYDISDIWRIIEAIDNKRERIKGASLFQTIKQWATTDIVLANRRREQLQQYS